MKFLPLVLANLRRKKVRTVLTCLSFAVALFLFSLLAAVRSAFLMGLDVAGADRLVVINKVSLIQPLPISYRERLGELGGVESVTFASWFGGIYQDERNFFPQFAVDKDTYREMFPEFVVSDPEWRDFLADREGAVAGASTAKRFGWKRGDRIPIRGTIFPGAWEFNLRGIYTGKRPQDDTTQFWFRYDYLEERGPEWIKGLVGWYTVRVSDPDEAARVARAIDERFANSPWETKTDTERVFAASFAKQMGNIQLLVAAIGSVVFFTLLLVTGNTMAIAVRERTGEHGVLKTLGYSDRFVLGLVLAEAILVAATGGLLGIALGKAFVTGSAALRNLLGPGFYLAPSALAAGLGLACLTGAVAALLPALAASRLRVVEALRRV